MSKEKYVTRFDKATAPGGHNDTILAGRALPENMKAPFGDAWGYLEGKSMMEAHSHHTDEVYFVFKGNGYCHIGDERFAIESGDVIQVPPDVSHTMECEDGNSLLWVALWWEQIK